MDLKYYFIGTLFYLYCQLVNCDTESITFISTERPVVEWYNTKYLKTLTFSSRRASRQDPRHYVEIYMHTLCPYDKHIMIDFYFYQFLTNRYRPSFVEMHFKFCDMLNSDSIFGIPVKIALQGRTCPLPPGEYTLKNMSIPYVPKGFPFVKGRIYCNVSIDEDDVLKQISRTYIDMEVKVSRIKKN